MAKHPPKSSAGSKARRAILPKSSLSVPERVAILGLGPSLEAYVDVTKRLGNRGVMFDEVWGINQAVDVIHCDRGFHMDDVRVQELRAKANPDGNIAAMLKWLRRHPGPIYTSIPNENYPGLIAYPLADVMNSCGKCAYFNSTAAYAVAYAIHIGVKKLYLFGCDFSFANGHEAERGRACVEFYLGMAKARGISIGLPSGTSLMDGIATNDERLYGYDGVNVQFDDPGEGKSLGLKFTERDLPTAEEIEARYDHRNHPNLLMKA